MEKSLKEVMEEFVNRKLEEFSSSNNKEEEDVVEEEVCIEPFAFTDENGNVLDYKELKNIMAESMLELEDDVDIEIDEEDIIADEVKEIANAIQPIDLVLDVNYGERHLIDKVNCNIKNVPLINSYFITNRDIFIVQVTMTDEMIYVNEIEIAALIKMEEKYALCTMNVGELNELGLIKVHNALDDLEMNNVEFRGLTSTLHVEELEELFKDYEFGEDVYALTSEEIF